MSGPTAFEERYRRDQDPWNALTDPTELSKAKHVLEACGPGPFDRVCDVGAGNGVLTAQLAARCRELLAIDGAPSAVEEANGRLKQWPGAEARVGAIPQDLPLGPFDLVVASEVLFYLTADEMAGFAGWLTGALAPGGRIVAVHWTGNADDIEQHAEICHDTITEATPLLHLGTEREPTYRLDIWEQQ